MTARHNLGTSVRAPPVGPTPHPHLTIPASPPGHGTASFPSWRHQITWIFLLLLTCFAWPPVLSQTMPHVKAQTVTHSSMRGFFLFFFGNVTFIFMPLSVCFNCSGELSHSQLCKLCGVLFVLSAWQTPSSCAGNSHTVGHCSTQCLCKQK